MEKARDWIENFIENKNWLIQIIYLLSLIVLAFLFELNCQNVGSITIELLFVIAGELCILNTRDSIVRKKIEAIRIKQDIDKGLLFRVADFDLVPFFNESKRCIFISGMSLNHFLLNCKNEMDEYLYSGKKMYILMSAPDAVEQNAKLFFGVYEEKKIKEYVKRLINQQLNTLERIETDYINFSKMNNYSLVC